MRNIDLTVSAKDIFHESVKKALQKEQWSITSDPLKFKFGEINFQIYLGGDCRVDKLAKYQEYVKTLLTNYANDDVSDNDVEVQLILGKKRLLDDLGVETETY